MIRPILSLAAVVVLAAPMSLAAQSWKTFTSSRLVTNEDRLSVSVGYGAGVLKLGRGDAGSLYRALFRFDEESADPIAEYGDQHLEVGISVHDHRGRSFRGRSDGPSLDLQLGPDVPADIELDFGAGRADVDLTGIPVSRLELNTGASESVLRIRELNPEPMEEAIIAVGAADLRVSGLGNFNTSEIEIDAGLGSVVLELDGRWAEDAMLSVEMGLGALEIRVPESLGIRVRRQSRFLSTFDAERLVRRGNVYQSVNWDTADRRVEIEISAALGSVDIVWID
ncbi:MAG: hypothetical protein OXN18_15970 [Gemmatimonadota bacterium]|nr:hypothetical protein [Gemmatimonadota bacterium]